MKPRVIILRGNAMVSDPRVEKVIDILSPTHDLSIVAFDRTGKHPKEDHLRGIRVDRFHGISILQGSKLKGLNALFYQCYLFLIALVRPYDIMHACDFKTFAPTVLGVKLRGKKIAYDIFDFFFDMVFTLPPAVKRALIQVDLFTMRMADLVILADDTRKAQIQAHRLNNLIVFYNSPADVYARTERFRNHAPQDGYSLNLIYVGLVDNRKRDFQFALDTIAKRNEVSLDVYGAGRDYEGMSAKYASHDNIRFMGKVPYEQILNVEAEYDGVFAVYDPSIPNNVLASPNKLFEAMMLAKPVILNREVVAARLIEEYNIGYTYTFNDAPDFERVIDEMLNSPEVIDKKGQNGRTLYINRFGFEEQRRQLLAAYRLLGKP